MTNGRFPARHLPAVEDSASHGGRGAGARILAVFLAAELTFVAVSVLVLVAFGITDPGQLERGLPPEALLAQLAVPTVLAALVAVTGVALFGGGRRAGRIRRELAARWWRRDILLGLAIGVAGLVITVPAAAVWATWVGTDQAGSAVGEAFGGKQFETSVAVTLFLVVWLVAPLCEEVLFRGVLWRALEHWQWNRWLIFLTTTVVFSVAHLELLRTPLLVVLSIPIGLARLVTGNLLSSVVAHQVNNFLPALGLLLATSGLLPW